MLIYRLLLLVLVAALPVMAVQVIDQLRERSEQRAAVAADATRMADLLAEQLSQVVESARGLTTTTGHLPSVRERQPAVCQARLRALSREFPEFTGIAVAGVDGDTFCRASGGESIYVGDRAYFQEALDERRFVASGFMIGRETQRPSLVFAAPSFGADGAVAAIVLVAYDVDDLSERLARANLVDDAVASLVDPNGIVLARYPPADAISGEHVRSPSFMEAVRAQGRGAVSAQGSDGVERIYGFAPLNEPARFYAMVGLPLGPAFARIDARLWQNLGVLASIFALAALAAMIGGEFGIRRPLASLQGLARRLAAGDLAARTQLDRRAIGEVGALAASFDDMAQAVEERETALRASEELNRRILASSRDSIKVLDLAGRLKAINECGVSYLEIADAADVLDASYVDLWTGEDHKAALAALDAAKAGGAGRFLGHYRTPSGRDIWWDEVVTPICDAEGWPERLLVVSREVTDQKRAEEQRELLMAELDHRVKNTLAAVQSIASRTMGRSPDVESFSGRLGAMAKAHNLLSRSRWEGAELVSLLHAMLDAYGARVSLDGPDILLTPKMTQTLGMVVHELATNAAKYGALFAEEGRVALTWRLEVPGDRLLVLEWREEGGPTVRPPRRPGFGIAFIERSLAYEFGGKAALDFAPQGLCCRLVLPLGGFGATGAASDPQMERAGMTPAGAAALAGSRILLVEDGALTAMQIDEMLVERNCSVVGPAARLDSAMRLAEQSAIDAAVLDVNLDGQLVFPLATRLREMGVPFVFMTGYDSRAVFPPEFKRERRVGKPVDPLALIAALVAAIEEKRRVRPDGTGLAPAPARDPAR